MPTREQRTVFAGLLTHARTEAGLSQAELAARLGVHRNTVSQYERGEIAPSDARCAELETVLGLDAEEFSRHLFPAVGDVTPEAAIEQDDSLNPLRKRIALAVMDVLRRHPDSD